MVGPHGRPIPITAVNWASAILPSIPTRPASSTSAPCDPSRRARTMALPSPRSRSPRTNTRPIPSCSIPVIRVLSTPAAITAAAFFNLLTAETPGPVSTVTRRRCAVSPPIRPLVRSILASAPNPCQHRRLHHPSLIGPAVSGVTALAVAGGHVFVGSQISADIYVTKFDPQGNILYSTYIGGASDDEASAMAVDASGSVYVTGTTYSTDFPATAGAYAPVAWGGVFVVKLNPDGSLAYSTGFSGGIPNAIAVDRAGRVLIAGLTHGGLPVTSGAYQTTFRGSYPPGIGD